MIHRLTRAFAAALLVLGVAAGQAPAVHGLAAAGPGWGAMQSTGLSYAPQGPGVWDNQTLRMVARVSTGGTSIRIRLADTFSSQAAQIGHVTVGTQMNGGSTVEQTPTTVLFGGAQAVTVPAGGTVASDPVAFTVTANTRLLVSIYIAAGAQLSQAPRHDLGNDTEYNHNGGDASAAQYYLTSNTFTFTTLLDGIDVQSAAPATVVAVGDSITDGLNTMGDTDTRWPDYLAARLAGTGLAVIDQGIGGNWVTADQGASGQSLQNRWARDVLNVPGVRTVIDADGINDLRGGVSAAVLESAQASLVASAHTAGLRVLLSTITPCGGEAKCTTAVQAQIVAYNVWVRSGLSGADAVADFDSAIDTGGFIKPMYDSGDHLHPNSAGAAALANVIDMSKL
jgi:lysophospholipase L1-like esterase